MIIADGLTKSFKDINALKGVSFTVNQGEIMGFLGPNGAGKTTTIKILCGLSKPDKGSISIMNHDSLKDYGKVGSKISVIFENPGLYNFLTGEENLEFFARLADISSSERKIIVERALKDIDLYDRRKSLVKTYSKGMARRLAIARTIITNPQILILDEPFDGIDAISRQSIIQLLRDWICNKERCIIMTSHNMADIESMCNTVTVIKSGKKLLSEKISKLYESTKESKIEVYLSEIVNKHDIDGVFSDNPNIEEYYLEGSKLILKLQKKQGASQLSTYLISKGFEFQEIKTQHDSLEEMYIKWVKDNE